MKSFAAVLTGAILITVFPAGDLFSGTGKKPIKWISASSTLKGKNNRYGAGNLLDGSSGSWCEGVKGDGIGEKITLLFRKEVTLTSLSLINGLKSGKYFGKNNRVKGMKINGESHILQDSPGPQKITLHRPVKTKKLVLEIESVYPGTKWKDTCITELGINTPVKVTGDYGDGLMGSISGVDWRTPEGLFDKYGSIIIAFNRALLFFGESVPCGDESCPMTYSGYCRRVSKGKYRCTYRENCYGRMEGPNMPVIRVCKEHNSTFILRIVEGKPEIEFKGKREVLVKD